MARAVRAFSIGVSIAVVTATVVILDPAAGPSLGRAAAVPTTVPTASPQASPPAAGDVFAAFDTAGVVITSIDAPVFAGGVTLTDWQADNLSREASVGAGLTGAQLRASFPVADHVVPIDAVVAAWLITGESATAAAARSIMPIDVATIVDPALVSYPWAVLVLFVHDLTSSTSTSTPGSEPVGFRDDPPRAAPASPQGSGVCGALSGFYNAMTAAVVAALEDVPILGTLAEFAIQRFEQVLGTALKPLLVPIQLAITALGVAAIVAHIIDPWVFFIDKEPLLVIDYGIAPNPGSPGSFTARVEGGAILEWPAAIQACAALADVQLPDLDPNGATVNWTTAFGPHASVTSQHDTMTDTGGAYTATLEYITAVEPAENATGAPVSATIDVSATVVRPAEQQLDAVVEQIVGDALSGLPGPVADLLASLAGSAIGSIAQFDDQSRNSSVTVRFHSPPPPTTAPTTPPPTTSPPSCIGRLLQGQSEFAGITLEIRANGTWTMDFAGFPPQVRQDVTVTLAGQWIGTWAPTGDGTGFAITTDLDSPFTATGHYQGTTLQVTIQDLMALFLSGFGVSAGSTTAVVTCTNGTITSTTGDVLFA